MVEAGSGKVYAAATSRTLLRPDRLRRARRDLKAVSEGETEIKAVVIVAGEDDEIERPCGACLQVMQEFAPEERADGHRLVHGRRHL